MKNIPHLCTICSDYLELLTSVSFGTSCIKCSIQIYRILLCLILVLIVYNGNSKYATHDDGISGRQPHTVYLSRISQGRNWRIDTTFGSVLWLFCGMVAEQMRCLSKRFLTVHCLSLVNTLQSTTPI